MMDAACLDRLNRQLGSGLLGYQPFALNNGIVLGAGLQFFAGGNEHLKGLLRTAGDLPNAELGNIFIPRDLRGKVCLPESDYYIPVSEENAERFIDCNERLERIYQNVIDRSFAELAQRGVKIESFVELGGNTGLFGSMALRYVDRSVSVDIVNYAGAFDVLAELADYSRPEFHHLKSLRAEDIDRIPVCDLGWSYAVALHQSNPMIHICDLSSISRKACLIMTAVGRPGELDHQSLMLKFRSSNTYYAAKFPSNFDVSLMSEELIRFSLHAVGFDDVVEIPFPDWCPHWWLEQHRCYLGIRRQAGAPSIYSFARSPERDGVRSVDPEVITLSHQGVHSNIIGYKGGYYIIPHGMQPDAAFLDQSRLFANLNQAYDMLDSLPAPAIVPR